MSLRAGRERTRRVPEEKRGGTARTTVFPSSPTLRAPTSVRRTRSVWSATPSTRGPRAPTPTASRSASPRSRSSAIRRRTACRASWATRTCGVVGGRTGRDVVVPADYLLRRLWRSWAVREACRGRLRPGNRRRAREAPGLWRRLAGAQRGSAGDQVRPTRSRRGVGGERQEGAGVAGRAATKRSRSAAEPPRSG